MAHLRDVIAYIIKSYPAALRHELSNARLTKMIYLADWHQAINHRRQISNIEWYFDNYGPFVNDVKKEAEKHSDLFDVNSDKNMYGQKKAVFSLKNENYQPELNVEERASIDRVVEATRKIYWDDFIKLVYSTHPITSSERYSCLDLVGKAEEYRKQKYSMAQ
jgi:hypothetical protein